MITISFFFSNYFMMIRVKGDTQLSGNNVHAMEIHSRWDASTHKMTHTYTHTLNKSNLFRLPFPADKKHPYNTLLPWAFMIFYQTA